MGRIDTELTIDELARRIRLLQARMPEDPSESDPEAWEVLRQSLEELCAADVELRQQNEELIEARRAVETEYRRYHDLFEFAPDGYLVTDPRGAIRECNRQGARLLGTAQEFIIGKPLTVFVGKADRRALVELLRLLADGKETVSRELALHPLQAAPFPAMLDVAPALDSMGRVDGLRWLIRDLSDRKRMEHDLREAELESERRRLEVRLGHAQKMEALGQLAGGIAHDFNNLLTAILGYADLAQDRLRVSRSGQVDGAVVHAIDEILRAGRRASSLTHQLLAFGRREPQELRPLDVNRVVTQLVEMLQRLIGEHIRLEIALKPGIAAVRADASQLEQVIVNLVLNARDAMPSGGTLVIQTDENPPGGPGPRRGGAESSREVLLAVSDDGTGMDERTRERLFEPFFTTKGKGKGTGLGLATVYGIVTQAGGKILVESELGSGTTFRVLFPGANGAAAAAPAASNGAAGLGRGGTGTVLVCEDEGSVRRLMCAILAAAGYEVLEAEGASQALRHVEEHRGAIDLLLSDIVMPEVDGLRLAERVREAHPGIKTLFVSGYSQDHIRPEFLQRRPLALLAKPFSAAQLLESVRRLCAG